MNELGSFIRDTTLLLPMTLRKATRSSKAEPPNPIDKTYVISEQECVGSSCQAVGVLSDVNKIRPRIRDVPP